MTLEDFTEFTDRDDGGETTDAAADTAADAPEPAAENTDAEDGDTSTGTGPESTAVTDPTASGGSTSGGVPTAVRAWRTQRHT